VQREAREVTHVRCAFVFLAHHAVVFLAAVAFIRVAPASPSPLSSLSRHLRRAGVGDYAGAEQRPRSKSGSVGRSHGAHVHLRKRGGLTFYPLSIYFLFQIACTRLPQAHPSSVHVAVFDNGDAKLVMKASSLYCTIKPDDLGAARRTPLPADDGAEPTTTTAPRRHAKLGVAGAERRGRHEAGVAAGRRRRLRRRCRCQAVARRCCGRGAERGAEKPTCSLPSSTRSHTSPSVHGGRPSAPVL